jgi:hypothetical protein
MVCDEYKATLLVDCAHDLGCIGDDGLGHLGLQNMLHDVDIVVGSFSKTFAANGGFVGVKSRAAAEYLKYYSATQTFSNALSPVQAASVLAAFDVVRSSEGKERRQRLMSNILYLRSETKRVGLETLGDPSAIVPVRVGTACLAQPRRPRRHRESRRVSCRTQRRRPLSRPSDGRPQDGGNRRLRQGHVGGDALGGYRVSLLSRGELCDGGCRDGRRELGGKGSLVGRPGKPPQGQTIEFTGKS